MIHNQILRRDGIVYDGQWEPSYFLKQRGSNRENLASEFDFIQSEEHIAHLASLGVNQFWAQFHKGYGMAFEDAEQQRLRGVVERCHKHGLRVIAYCTFGTLTLDTLLAEEPGAADWVAKPDVFAHAPYYEYQSFRARVDYTSEEWLAYMVRVVDKALDLGADGIHFDNTEMAIGLEACRCSRCARLFRDYLTERYGPHTTATRKAGQTRYGTNDFAHVEPPWFTLSQHPVNQRQVVVPLHQDWTEFRCTVFAKAIRRLSDHIRGRGRLVEANLGKNENINNGYYRGLDYERTYPLVDFAFHENFDHPGFNRHGSPVCAIRSYKIADAFGVPLMIYGQTPLELLESFALNPGACGLAKADMNEERRRQFAFIKQWRHYNTMSTSLAQVAVLRHQNSMHCDTYYSVQTATAVEQVLQEDKVQFDILAASQLDRLPKYAVLIIPGMRWISDAEAASIAAWVTSGGRLLLVGEVGIRNEHNQKRSAVKTIRSLEDLRRSAETAPVFTSLVQHRFDAPFATAAGKGQVAFIPALEHIAVPGTELSDWRVERDHLNAPRNAAEVRSAIRNLLGDDVDLRVDAPQHVVAEFRRREDTGEGVLHLLNLGWSKGKSAYAHIAFRWPGHPPRVTALSWDGQPRHLPLGRRGELFTCSVEEFRDHVLLVIPAKGRPLPRPAEQSKRLK